MLACLRANSAFFDVKLVAAHGSVIYLPCFQIACNVPFAKWTNIVTLPRGNVSVFDTKTMPACTAVIYLACAHAAAHRRRTKRTRILEHFLAGFPSRQLCRRCVCLLRGSRRGLRILLRSCLRVCALIVVRCRPALCNTVSWWRRHCPGLGVCARLGFGWSSTLVRFLFPLQFVVCAHLDAHRHVFCTLRYRRCPVNNPGALVGKHEDACSANLGGKFTRRFCMP